MFRNQIGVECQIQVKVLAVGGEFVKKPGLGVVQLSLVQSTSPPTGPVMLHSVTHELAPLIHPHWDCQLIVLQRGKEFRFWVIK